MSKVSSAPNGKTLPDDASVDEKTPLKSGTGQGIDVDKLLEESLKIRLPRMDKEMKFGFPAKRERKGPMKKDAKQAVRKEVEKAAEEAKKEAYEAAKDMLPDGKMPTKSGLIAWAKKYAVDFITNSVYSIVGIILAFVGTAQQSVEASVGVGVNATADAVEDAQQQADELKKKTQAAVQQTEQAASDLQNQLLAYWVIVAGCVTSVLVVIKNVRWICTSFFTLIDKIEDKINEGIDVLQKELQEEVTEILEDSMDSMGDDPIAKEGQKLAVSTIVGKLKTAIDDAQKQVPDQLEGLLPWVARRKHRLVLVLGVPCVVVVAAKCVLDLYLQLMSGTSSSITATTTMGITTTVFGAGDAGRRLVDFSDIEDELQSLYPMIGTLIVNLIVAVLSSNPVVRFITNNAIRLIEKAVNFFILKEAKDKVPTEEIQQALDAVGLLSGGMNMKSMRQCTKDCSIGQCALQ